MFKTKLVCSVQKILQHKLHKLMLISEEKPGQNIDVFNSVATPNVTTQPTATEAKRGTSGQDANFSAVEGS